MDRRLNTYRTAETEGKSQLDLVIQVYDGAIAAFKSAAEHYREKENDRGYEQLERARRFVTHLYTTLDAEKGGDISEQLARLYAYVINNVNVLEATKDLDFIDDNVTILSNLRDGWIGLREQNGQRPAPPQPETATVEPGGFVHSA